LLNNICCCFEIDNTKDAPDKVLPIFITVDPARDDVKTVAEYIKGKEMKSFSFFKRSKYCSF
jgi:cytochrome oxidase Cu insertion factor (SCO1/SenC/PrrC family)